nr:hypothetical protein [Bradyrhizobium sp. CCBAU 53380]
MAEDLNIAGGMPPAFRNNLLPTGCDMPASNAASSLLCPVAIALQNLFCSSRPRTAGLAMAMALVLTVPNVDLQLSSQPPTSGCCDGRLNPPFVNAYNFAKRLKTLKGLTPYPGQSARANAGTKHLERASSRLNRLGFPNQAGSDSNCLPAKEAGGHGDIHFGRSSEARSRRC